MLCVECNKDASIEKNTKLYCSSCYKELFISYNDLTVNQYKEILKEDKKPINQVIELKRK